MKKSRFVAMLLVVMMLFSYCIVANADDSTYDPFWIEPVADTVTLDVVIGWGPDSSLKEGTTPETNALVDVLRDMNIELNILWMVSDDQFSERLALQLSSGDIPDVLMLESQDFYDFLDADYLRDLTDAYDTWACDELRSTMDGLGADALKYASKDGKIYGIPAVLDPAEGVGGLYYRSDWLEALDMEVPTNMDEVNDMLVAFANYGSTVNGNKTTAGLGTTSGVLNNNFALGVYFQCYGSYPNRWIMRDGELVNGLLLDETVDALNGLHYLYENGAIATDFATWDSDTFVEYLTNDQVGATFGTYYIAAWPLNLNKEANTDAEWAEINLPDLGGKAKPAMNQTSLQFFNVVTKDAPANAEEACIKILNVAMTSSANSTENKDFFNGRDLGSNGATPFWLPVYMYYPTPWERIRENVWEAYDAKDESLLTTDYARELYGYMNDWLTNGVNSTNLGNAWGQYKSRLTTDMGIAIGLDARETGYYETNYYYGPTTETESKASSTLSDLTTEFVIQYILGQKTEADWESFKEQYNQLGGEQIAKEINEQYTSITQ